MKKRYAGFTLVEVLVALSITVIVMSLVASLVVIVTRISNRQAYESECQTEYKTTNTVIENYFNNYSIPDFLSNQIVVTDSQVVVQNSENQYELTFVENEKKLVAQMLNHTTGEVETKTINLQYIIEINFSADGNIVLCEFVFDNYPTYKNLITFGV